MKSLLNRITATIVCVAHLGLVSVARSEETKTIDQFLASAEWSNLSQNLDSVLQQNKEALESLESPKEAASKNTPKRIARIEKRLRKRIPKILAQYTSKISKLNDAFLISQIAQWRTIVQESGDVSALKILDSQTRNAGDLRQISKKYFEISLIQNIPIIAKGIVDHGGIAPYLTHLKTQIKSTQESTTAVKKKSSSKMDRSPAANKVGSIALITFGIALLVLTPFAFYFLPGPLVLIIAFCGWILTAAGLSEYREYKNENR